MGRALFLGNSHIAAYKLAYDAPDSAFPRDCDFFCARGADLAFTEVRDGAITPVASVRVGLDELRYFFPDGVTPALEARYTQEGVPMLDVGLQFEKTGGRPAIDLAGVEAIFYAAGISPYDVRRLETEVGLRSPGLIRQMAALLLQDRFLLREQIRAIRAAAPGIRHYLLGMPFEGLAPLNLSEQALAILAANRQALSAVARDFLFDDVFLPGPSVLAGDTVSVRAEFFESGREQAEAYQGVAKTRSDHLHVNSRYAAIVFDEFIGPRLA